MTIAFRDDMVPGNWRSGRDNATAFSQATRDADTDQQFPSYSEIVRQTWADTTRVQNQDASATNRIEAYDAANDRIKAATGVSDLINPARDGAVPRLPGQPVMPGVPYPAQIDGVGTTPVEQWKARLAELRKQHPDALDWDDITERPERDAWAKMKDVREATERLDQRMGAIRGDDIPYLRNVPLVREVAAVGANLARAPVATLLQFGAGFAGAMTSPIDAAANVLGFSAGTRSMSLLRTATNNALANAAVQAPLSAAKLGDYQNAGLPFGWNVWLSEVEGAASAGFVLDAAFRAPVRAVRAYRGETGLGGVLLDAVPEAKMPAKPEGMAPIAPETIAASERGDLAATRQILEATGAIDDPEVRGALNHMETVGRLDAAALERLRELGVPRAEGMRILDGLVNGRYVRPADVAADVDRMTTPLLARIPDVDAARVVDTARASLDALAPGLADMVTMAVEARAQSIEGPVRRALEALEGAKPDPARIAETLAREVRDVLGNQAEAERIGRMIRVASGSASSPEIARMVQDDPGLKASLNIDLSRHAEALALSTLNEADLSRVLAGDVPPQVGAWIANHIPVAKHGEALDVIAKARPADMAEAVRLLDETVDQSNVARETSLARTDGMSEPTGAELQRRVELMREDAGEAVKAAQEPIKERDTLDSKVEVLKGEIAKIEEKAAKQVGPQEPGSGLPTDRLQDSPERMQRQADLTATDPARRILTENEGRQEPAARSSMMRDPWSDTLFALSDPNLPMDLESRKARAESMGFDTTRVWHHVTDVDFEAFSLRPKKRNTDSEAIDVARAGVWFSDAPARVSSRTGMDADGGRTIPVYVRGELYRAGTLTDVFNMVKRKGWKNDLIKRGYAGIILKDEEFSVKGNAETNRQVAELADKYNALAKQAEQFYSRMSPLPDDLRAAIAAVNDELRPLTAKQRREWAEGQTTSIAVFDPRNIRSVNAAFDPARADSPNLLYSLTDADASTLAKKRAELHEAETQLADANLRLNPDPVSARELHAFAMRSIAIRREQDVRRAVAHAVMLGRTIAPEGTRIDVRTEEMRSDTGQLVEAYYVKGDGAIVLASYAADPTARMGHEVVHALVDVDALSPAEVKLLADEAVSSGVFTPDMRQRYADAYKDRANVDLLLQEEAAAHLIDARISGKAKGAENTIAGRLAQVIERLRNLIKGYGFRSREDVVAAVLNGEAARRAQRAEPVQRWMADNDVSAMAVRLGATPEQMFSLADRDTGRSMRRDMDALGYYSKLDEVLAGLGPKDKVTADTLQKRGVKAAEMEARGLMPMLADGKAAAVADLRETAGRNRVEMRESQRFVDPNKAARRQLRDEYNAQLRLPRDQQNTQLMAELESRLDDMMDEFAVNYEQYEPKWSKYSLDPSNPTYRETVLHLPESKVDVEEMSRNVQALRARVTEPGLSFDEMLARRQEADRAAREMSAESTRQLHAVRADFRSRHFSEPNIIGHMMTSMVRHEGQPVYLIDQIQSDWGQRIRDQGGPAEDRSAKIASIKKQLDEFGLSPAAKRYIEGHQGELNLALANAVSGLRPNDPVRVELRAITPERRQEYYRLTAELKTLEKEGIAGNPLVNTTDQWVNTTLRRAIRQAAEADAAFIAVPSGDTVLSYNPGDDNGMRQFYGFAGSSELVDQFKNMAPEALAMMDPETIKAVQEGAQDFTRPIEGIVPKNLRKLLEKLDKNAAKPIKVDTLETPTKGQAGSGFTLFPLTDKVKRSVIDDGQVMFAFAGERAKTADLKALARAKEMETAGTDRTTIWTDTGWFRGVDGKWRFEIDDSGAQLDLTGAIADGWQPNQKWPIDNVLTHRSLAAAYPDMNSRGIFYRDFPRGFDDAAASVTKTEGSIALNRRYRDFGSDERMLSSVMHEGQHVVQRSEGFARGGSPREFSPDELAAERARVLAIPEDPNSWNISTASGDMSDLDAGRLLYRRLAGEVEARAVQKRFDMTAAERRARPPWMDYDVPEDQQIVRFADGSGPMFALADRLDMSPEARRERAKAWRHPEGQTEAGRTYSAMRWFHGANRADRIAEAGKFDPKRATSGPMAFFTDAPELASKYATGKQDTSMPGIEHMAQSFTVSPKDMGSPRERTPYTVEQTWFRLSPEQQSTIMSRVKRIGFENIDQADGPLVLHPEGVEAINGDHFDFLMRREERGNPLGALRNYWIDSGNLFGSEEDLVRIYQLAGYPFPISTKTAPWYEAPGVIPVVLQLRNPLVTSDDSAIAKVVAAFDVALKGDRSRRAEGGADAWDKNTRYTPKEWLAQLKEDVANGVNSFVWTSIPDKITAELRRLGYDGIVDTGGKKGGDTHNVAIPFDPQQVRSVNAAFDPARADSPNLMFALADQPDAPATRPILETEYGAIDRMNQMKNLIEACAA